MRTDPIKRALALRDTLITEDKKKILVTDFSNTLQGKDTSKVIDLMPNVDNGEYVFRAKCNVKKMDAIAAEKYGKEYVDISKMDDKGIEDMIRKEEFDFPLWFKHNKGFEMKKVHDYNFPFILQVAGCNFHDGSEQGGCWYCFVDDKSNNGVIESGKTWLGGSETIDSLLEARKKVKQAYKPYGQEIDMKVLRTSGGEPTIVLDWILNMWREIGDRNLDFVGQLDTNLSTGALVDYFETEDIFERNTLDKLAEYPIKVLTALKGTDDKNLQSNVQSSTTMKHQEYSIKKILKAGFDIYPQMYNPNPKTLRGFLEHMDKEIENLALKIHIGPLKCYGPTKARLGNKEEPIETMQKQWDDNYQKGCEVMDEYLREKHGVGYKDVVRSDVKLKLKSAP